MNNLDIMISELLLKVNIDLILFIREFLSNSSIEVNDKMIADLVVRHLIGNDIRAYSLKRSDLRFVHKKMFTSIIESKII